MRNSGFGNVRCALLCGAVLLPGQALAQTEQGSGTQQTASASAPDEIVVTATRQVSSINSVPISISAFDTESLDKQNVRQVDDLARISPGVTFNRSSGGNGNQTNIAIRGISSTIGASTTGIYINDTPIQVRTIGVTAATAYPRIFDLERIEVLRGPQGTLFGASSQGGAIRFITPRPDLRVASIYGRSEISVIQSGGMNYELGLAGGAPVVEDALAFRVSGWLRHDGGWVDRVGPLTESGFDPGKIDTNINSQHAYALKADLLWEPAAGISFLPSVYYQKVESDDITQFFRRTSDPDQLEYNTPNQLELPSDQTFFLASLTSEVELGSVELISNTAYFTSELNQLFDYTYQSAEQNSTLVPYITIPGQNEFAVHFDEQKSFTQEVRLQSRRNETFNWVLGAFYMHSRQTSAQDIVSPFVERLIQQVTGNPNITIAQIFGGPLLPGDRFLTATTEAVDEQIAAFAQVDYNITDKLTLTAGLRVSNTSYDAEIVADGPLNGGPTRREVDQQETPLTPKFGLSYQADPTFLLYASASKGFRPGASQPENNSPRCVPDLDALGLERTPTSYGSDSLWSYEIGAKKRIGAVNIQASGYLIHWDDIQQRIVLPTCGQAFIVNLGSVTSRGFDLAVSAQVTDGLSLSTALSYTKADFDETVYSVPPVVVRSEGSDLPIVPFSVTASAQYDIPLSAGSHAYIRGDLQYLAESPRGSSQDFGYDPLVDPIPESTNVDLRLGWQDGSFDVSLFSTNVFNQKPLQYFRVARTSELFRAQAPRPRTIGLNMTFRH
ncbi:TonB-dependent receptor [Aurantiacibacter flavus]|uniref:TonB-dependent receptor n=1 Tax=Aurantiacibacter flavus TaxID=3145232 RepID=A0ABV0CVS2_9SPHN